MRKALTLCVKLNYLIYFSAIFMTRFFCFAREFIMKSSESCAMNICVMKLAVIQYAFSNPATREEWTEHVRSFFVRAREESADLVVFPEYASLDLLAGRQVSPEDWNSQAEVLSLENEFFCQTFSSLAREFNLAVVAPSIPVRDPQQEGFENGAYVFDPAGHKYSQEKYFMTRFEDEKWTIRSGQPTLSLFSFRGVSFGIQICFDVEFPWGAMALAHSGAQLLLVPSCTEALFGASRVHTGAKARALENQMIVAVSQTLGNSQLSTVADVNTGWGAVYAPSDDGFSPDGVELTTELNRPDILFYDVDPKKVEHVRVSGQVKTYLYNQPLSEKCFELFRVRKFALQG
jgi:predicted amidohydrolase